MEKSNPVKKRMSIPGLGLMLAGMFGAFGADTRPNKFQDPQEIGGSRGGRSGKKVRGPQSRGKHRRRYLKIPAVYALAGGKMGNANQTPGSRRGKTAHSNFNHAPAVVSYDEDTQEIVFAV